MLMRLQTTIAVVLAAQPTTGDERSAAITVLLVGLGAAVGVIVGVIPALVAAMLLGYLPPPPRWWRSQRASGVLVEPPPLVELGSTHVPGPAPVPVVLAEAEEPSGELPRQGGRLAILAHARHQDVYDTAYAEQLERVGALRSAIGDRRRAAPEPPNDPDSGSPVRGTP